MYLTLVDIIGMVESAINALAFSFIELFISPIWLLRPAAILITRRDSSAARRISPIAGSKVLNYWISRSSISPLNFLLISCMTARTSPWESRAGPTSILTTLKTLTKLSMLIEKRLSLSPWVEITSFFEVKARDVSPPLDWIRIKFSSLSSNDVICLSVGNY
jgi:hypothetical protein